MDAAAATSALPPECDSVTVGDAVLRGATATTSSRDARTRYPSFW
jgi:hypothetical protein